jgi:hypothetical protein
MGRRLLYLLIQRNLLAGLDWRVGLPSVHSYSSITDYLRDFGIKYTSCFTTEDVAGCETSQAMLIPDTYNAIILSPKRQDLPSLIDRYIRYLSPGGSIFIDNEVVYTRPRVVINVPCDALTTYGGSLSPIELYSIDWEIIGCKDVATASQPPSESAKVIRVCSKDVKHDCVDPIELAIRLNRFASVIEQPSEP